MQEVKEEKILFYNGTYVKDRRFGKNSDYLTYEENPKRDYNIYLDLETGNVYNVDISECKKFEEKNIIVKIPVVAYSSNEYMYNYMKLQTWYNKERNFSTKEEIIKKVKENPSYKYKKLCKACHKYSSVQLKVRQ